MAVFEYRALNAKGKKAAGIVDADSLLAAQEKLKKQHLFPVELKAMSAGEGRARPGFARLGFVRPVFFTGIRASEISTATRLIATLLSAGFPLVKAVETVAGQTRSGGLQKVLTAVKTAMEEGSSFSDALGQYPRLFSSVYINMISAGEASGSLEVVLERLADFSERREETRREIQASLAYPAFMALTGTLVLIILLTYIIPGIIRIFSDMNQALPLPTLILVGVSDFFRSFWWAVMLMPFLAWLGLSALRTTDRGTRITDRLVLGLPLAGGLTQKIIAARFSRTLGALLENGIPMLGALKIAGSVTGNRVISDLIRNAEIAVEQGGQLGEILSRSRFFPSLACQMIRVGEKSGEMEKMLMKSADIYDKEVRTAVKAATALIEPAIILVMGAIVGLIIMAVCLPIVEINQFIA